MRNTGQGAGDSIPPERIAAVAIGAYILYSLIVGLEGTGLHFLELGVMRLVLFGALFAFAGWSGASKRRLGKSGIGLSGAAAVAFVAGGIGAIVTDGWSYDVFAASAPADPPWYAYVIGLSGILFALGAVLVGISGRAAGRLAAAAIVAGASFPIAFALGATAGHVAWLSVWLVLSIGVDQAKSHGRRHGERVPANSSTGAA